MEFSNYVIRQRLEDNLQIYDSKNHDGCLKLTKVFAGNVFVDVLSLKMVLTKLTFICFYDIAGKRNQGKLCTALLCIFFNSCVC